MTSWNRESLLDFIRIYKEEECLWRVKSDGYHDKEKCEKSYQRLLLFMRQQYPGAQKDDIRRKIKNLRTVFRKEEKQVKDALLSGAVYSPRLWYYKELEFLTDQEEGRSSVSSMSQKQNKDVQHVPSHEHLMNNDRIKDDDHEYDYEPPLGEHAFSDSDMDESNQSYTTYDTSVQQQNSRERTAMKRKRDHDYRHAEVKQMLADYKGPKSDKFDTFGQYVSHSLRQMSAEQYIHTQKLIADALYEGQLGNLSRRSRLLADPE
ncbi:hypothetical protein EGW08_003744 [Elysia chlorotica]|uniref:MADF domain-containing protein n=1 Tax=Elysia chlorotica TaxID=188477 RepID=A0A433U3T9_ELYCH|nr:hypothetical protein EGW08_003744 [Elysia chlorotica]